MIVVVAAAAPGRESPTRLYREDICEVVGHANEPGWLYGALPADGLEDGPGSVFAAVYSHTHGPHGARMVPALWGGNVVVEPSHNEALRVRVSQ